ncbi:MAG: PA14 domain-containing protein, partial [Lentisphaeraceae bacterium]|nr:PA14 domain-containing protein [Lentisphaeraceae bacterium]
KTKGLKFSYYEFSRDGFLLEDLSGLDSKMTGSLTNLSISPKGARGNDFGIVYEGWLKIPKTDKYTFFISANDMTDLYINDKKVASSYNVNQEKKSLPLNFKAADYVKFKLRFIQKKMGKSLKFSVQSSTMKKVSIPESWFFQSPTMDELKVQELSLTDLEQGLNFDYYELNFDQYPNPLSQKPKLSSKSKKLNIKGRGTRKDHYAYYYSGYLNVPRDDTYTFYLYADDSASVSLNGKQVLYSQAGKPLAEHKIKLPKGPAKFSVLFRERNQAEQFSLSISSDNLKKKRVPDTWFYREKDKEPTDISAAGKFTPGLLCELYSKNVKFEDLHANRLKLYNEKVWMPTLVPELARQNTIAYRGFVGFKSGKFKFQLDAFEEAAVYVDLQKVCHSKGKKVTSDEIAIKDGYHLVEVFIKQSKSMYTGALKLSSGGKFISIRNRFMRMIEPSFKANFYYGSHHFHKLGEKKPSDVKKVKKIDIAASAQKDNYHMLMGGKIFIDEPGTYEIHVVADKRAKLKIDGEQVLYAVDTGKEGKVYKKPLKKGLHSYEVTYMQAGKGRTLKINVKLPTGKKVPFSRLIVQ